MKNVITKFENFLNEGTWASPKNQIEIEKSNNYILELKKFQKKIYNILGDDKLHDYLDDAIARMRELIKDAPTGKDWEK